MRWRFPLLALAVFGAGCSSSPDLPPLPHPAAVDVPRFMGRWYVIAHIPSWPERHAFAAVESYALRPDGRIQTTFTYRPGSFTAAQKSLHPIGTVAAHGHGAIWGMQFIWPIQAEYVIAWLDADYTQTLIARSKRDYVWYMARTPQVSAADYQRAVQRITALGYDPSRLRRVPQLPQAPR